MINNYFTLKALIEEWQGLKNSVLAELFSQSKDELSLALGTPEQDFILRILAKSDFFGIFLNEGYSRARKNTATLFEEIHGKTVIDICLSPFDRVLTIQLSEGYEMQIHLYRPRPNVLLIKKGKIMASFLNENALKGEKAPVLKKKELPKTFEIFQERWKGTTPIAQIRSAIPVFSEPLAKEVCYRLETENKEINTINAWEMSQKLLAELATPKPQIYFENGRAILLSLIPLSHQTATAESFKTVSEAVTIYARKRLSEQRFQQVYTPLFRILTVAVEKLNRQTTQLFEELAKPSRAEGYEAFGHLLMANPQAKITQNKLVLADFYSDKTIEIPVEEHLSVIENAERYYSKARKSRQARQNAETRSFGLLAQVEKGQALLKNLESCQHFSEVETFKKVYHEDLKFFIGSKTESITLAPYRLFEFNGFEILVGRNAKCNDELTFKIAKKTDLWFHARSVAGSHVVLRRTNLKQRPPQSVIEFAASLAAHFSQAKSSGLVPVQMTERKHIRKPKALPPGAVLVSHEEVILIEPWAG